MYKKIAVLVAALFVVGGGVVPVFASPQFLATENGTVTINSPVGDDTYVAGGTIIVGSDVKGDLFIGGGTIEVKGNVAGDLFIGGGTVTVMGNVGDDIRIGGGQITITGAVGDDVMVGGGSVVIADTANVKGDLMIGAGSFSLYGRVAGDLKVSGDTIRIRGTVAGNAEIRSGDELVFTDNAKIDGKLDYWAKVEDPELAKHAGSVEFHKLTAGTQRTTAAFGLGALLSLQAIGSAIWQYLAILILGGLLIWLTPKLLPRITHDLKKKIWARLGQGFVVLVVAPVLALLLLPTVIGIPLSGALMLLYALMLMITNVVAAIGIGAYMVKVEKSQGQQFKALVLGGLIYLVLGIIPVVGWFIKFAVFLIAVGGVWNDRYEAIKAGRY
ncbi:MAG: hypothetical protein V1826_00380 [bacterium]